MNTTSPWESDERTVAVENESYRLGFFLLSAAIFIDAAYRFIVRHEAPLDLLALVIVSANVCVLYQARQKALTRDRAKFMLRVALIWSVLGAIMGAIIVWFYGT